jgi:colanic acid/amylovoran biosynthesis protein
MRHPRIAIIHVGNTYNYGSMMMAENFIHYLQERDREIEFFVDNESDEDLLRLRTATGNQDISSYASLGYHRFDPEDHNRYLRQLYWFKDLHAFVSTLRKNRFDRLFILGGDDISEYYASQYGLLKMLYELRQMSRATRIVLVGQTIGPFRSWRKKAFTRLLDSMVIFTRDPVNYRYLKDELGLERLYRSSDLAFLDLARQDEDAGELLERYGLQDGSYVSLVPSGLWFRYHPDREKYVASWVQCVEALLEHPRLSDHRLLLLPHALKPPVADDRAIIESIKDRVQDPRLVTLNVELLPFQARQILGNGWFTVTGRMHAAISTFQMGKPALSLSYSVKYDGVIGKGLSREDLVLDATGPDSYRDGRFASAVEEKIGYLLDRYRDLVPEIEKEVKKQQDASLEQIEEIARIVRERSP